MERERALFERTRRDAQAAPPPSRSHAESEGYRPRDYVPRSSNGESSRYDSHRYRIYIYIGCKYFTSYRSKLRPYLYIHIFSMFFNSFREITW